MGKSSLEQVEGRCKEALKEKEELEKRMHSLRNEFDKERKHRQELGTKSSEFESEETVTRALIIRCVICAIGVLSPIKHLYAIDLCSWVIGCMDPVCCH